MQVINVRIRRGGGDRPSYFQEYQVCFEDDKDISVMNVLEKIYSQQDGTLAFFTHAACRQAACGKCMVKVNGAVKLACREKVTGDTLLLEPYSDRVVRDLVCGR